MLTKYSPEVEAHGQWCLDRMLGDRAINYVPPASAAIYVANEKRVREIMEQNRSLLRD
jgi:hypothetical protein